ncbi:hypothetical protein EDB19DRAFT_1824242 [Suillus lakei]|nr:hypothetical protein EDB19DRAFT_1824242 [Suillus lakei]
MYKTSFVFTVDRWKLDLLCSTSYPLWWKNHLDANGDYIKQSKKVKQADNTDSELDSQGRNNCGALSPSWRALKIESVNSPTDTTISFLAIIALDESVNPPVVTPTWSSPATANADTDHCSIVSPSDAHKDQPLSPLDNSVLLGSEDNASTAGISNSVSVSSIPSQLLVLLINPLAGSICCVLINPATVVNATMTPTTVPLAATSSNTNQTPEAPSPTSITNVTGPPESITSTVLLSSDNGSNTSVSLKKVVKIVGGGSTKEFNAYYSQLGMKQIKLYDTEAVCLGLQTLSHKDLNIMEHAQGPVTRGRSSKESKQTNSDSKWPSRKDKLLRDPEYAEYYLNMLNKFHDSTSSGKDIVNATTNYMQWALVLYHRMKLLLRICMHKYLKISLGSSYSQGLQSGSTQYGGYDPGAQPAPHPQPAAHPQPAPFGATYEGAGYSASAEHHQFNYSPGVGNHLATALQDIIPPW